MAEDEQDQIGAGELQRMKDEKCELLQKFLDSQPPEYNGEGLYALWDQLFDKSMQSIIVKTNKGPSNDEENPVFPYEKIQALVKDKDGENWKWPRMWQRLDEIERRGEAYREGEELHFGMPNKNPDITARSVLVVGGGPIGLRTAIELVMGGHIVTLMEKRREIKNEDGTFTQLGFTNRINRPHMWNFVRNDLAKLNGKDFLSQKASYPVFTEPDTSSIGIDELQCLLIKNALLLGVDFRLGVGFVDAKIKLEADTLMPMWEVECTYDAASAEKYGKTEGTNTMEFDCIVGCDGPRSTVRSKLQKHFGNVEKRKFMDCVGIVANVQKVPKKRLKELGFDQEPGDMSRTKMVFTDFFAKILEEAKADIETLIYYKASHHNYTIIVPKKAALEVHGLSGKVYSFHDARKAGESPMTEEKKRLKVFCRDVLKSAGIPVDDTAENGGFVPAPNDCMAFDFAECWNTKKSMMFSLPPPGYSEEDEGEWDGKRLVPFVALCGDALLEPFWPLGLGLKRGWQAVMDTAYAIDNLFNLKLFMEAKGKTEDEWDWEDHYEALRDQAEQNFEYCNRNLVSAELTSGEYADDGQVMTTLKKKMKDPQKPNYEVEINPWTRYKPLEDQISAKWRTLKQEEKNAFIHPTVSKTLAKLEHYRLHQKAKSGEIDYKGKELVSINGRTLRTAGKKAKEKKAPGAAPKSRRGKQ